MDTAQIRTLFAEIGPVFDLDQVSEFEGEPAWAIVAEGTVVTFEADEHRGVLVLRGEVGRPADDARLPLYDTMLQYNLAHGETGGARMALDGPGGAAVLLYDLPSSNLDTARLAAVTLEFVAVVRGWRELLGRAPVAASSEAGSVDPWFQPGAIRA